MTELELLTIFKEVIEHIDQISHVVVHSRTALKGNPLQREISIGVQTKENNEVLLNALIKKTLQLKDVEFTHSLATVKENAIIDYLFFKAIIVPCLN